MLQNSRSPSHGNTEQSQSILSEDQTPWQLEELDSIHRVLLIVLWLLHLHTEEEDSQREDGTKTECEAPDPF